MLSRVLFYLLLVFPVSAQTAPQRIITLSPHSAELVYFSGGAERLIGVSAFTDFPVSLKALPIVGDANGFDRERLLQLHPDLVIAWKQNLDGEEMQWLQHQSFQLIVSNPMSLDAIEEEIRLLGEILGTETVAATTLEKMRQQRHEMIRIAAQRQRAIKVMHQLWHSPLILLTDESMVANVLRLCGIQTPVHIDGLLSATISRELLFQLELDAIIIPDDGHVEATNPLRIPIVAADTLKLHRATPRLLDTALELCRKL